MACLAAATGLGLAIPLVVKRAIDALEADAATAPVARAALVIVGLAVANGAARLASRFLVIGAAQRVEYALRNDLYRALASFPPAFYGARSTGDLMARASSDVAGVKSLVGFGLISLAGTTFAFVGALTAMVAVDPRLTLYALVPYPVLVAVARRFIVRIHERTEALQEQLGAVSARVQETLAGMGVVRAYAMEAHVSAEFGAANREYLRRSLSLGWVQAQFTPLVGLIGGVGPLIVLWLGGREVIAGRMSLGALVAFNGYLAYLAWPTLALGYTLSLLRRGLTSMDRIREIVETPPPPDGTETVSERPPSLAFRDLHFAYDGRDPVLRGVTFDVRPGETVAVVGQTGSGKSTLGLLLARLREPPPGTVFVGGRDVTTLSRASLRATLGVVPQESFLFSRSIADNVVLGRDGIGPDDTAAAAAVAGVGDEVAACPRGWDTVVGERGLTVSGGQRQRLALARALAGDPPALVLDDVFASVDTAKEEEILRGLRRAAVGRTVLLMTHRLRAAQAADRIVVLGDGRVVETGTHDALVRAGGVYAQLWRIQQLEEEIARA